MTTYRTLLEISCLSLLFAMIVKIINKINLVHMNGLEPSCELFICDLTQGASYEYYNRAKLS